MSGDLITVTLVLAATGQSESMSVPSRATTVADLLEWAAALFGVDGHNVALLKDGKPLLLQLPQPNIVTTFSLHDAGIVEGDLLAVVAKQPQHPPATPAASSSRATTAGVAPPTAAAAASPPVGGLDFSSLLGTAAAGAAAAQSPSVPQPVVVDPPSEPVYYPDMNLQEAQQYNPHPMAMVKLLFSKEHLSKELNYYDPVLASKLLRSDLTMEQAAAVWRQAMVKVITCDECVRYSVCRFVSSLVYLTLFPFPECCVEFWCSSIFI